MKRVVLLFLMTCLISACKAEGTTIQMDLNTQVEQSCYVYPTVLESIATDYIYADADIMHSAICTDNASREYGYYIYADEPLYALLYEGLQAEQPCIVVRDFDVSVEYVKEMVYSLLLGNPDFWYVSMEFKVYHDTEQAISIDFNYRYTGEQRKSLQTELTERVQQIKEYFPYGATYYEQYRWLYDFVLSNMEYSTDGLCKDGCIAGLLFGKGDCDAYALTYSYLCRTFGLPCATDTTMLDDVPHIWNKVLYKGEWYNIDLTRGETGNGFMLTLQELGTAYNGDYFKYPVPLTTPNSLVIA